MGSVIAIIIAITPYLFYTYDSFPNDATWETFFFTYESKHYQSISTFAWIALGKIIPLLLLVTWFFTCKHWWYHIILIPIAMYSFQLMSLFNEDVQYYDEFEIYYLIPIMMVIVPLVYLIRLKLFDKYVLGIDLKKIDEEIKELEGRETLRKFYHQKKNRKDKASA